MSVTSVPGFVAAGVHAGVKAEGKLDLALVATADGKPVTAAGVFTRNKMTAAPVIVCRDHLDASGGQAAAIILNSGNANAATGDQGRTAARRMCSATARELGIDANHVLVCSTGLIGYQLPLDRIEAAIPKCVAARGDALGTQAAEAMMTTDTVPKTFAVEGPGFTVGGIAKGAAMLEPNMATMLAVLTTDAALEPAEATAMLRTAVAESFNKMSVDGAQSTNDTVLLLANGSAGRADAEYVQEAITKVCKELAQQMVDDAEGSTKTVFIHVVGAAHHDEAATVGRSIGTCQLVKCSWYGEDPYWGRIASEAGSSAQVFDPTALVIDYGGHTVYDGGKDVQVDHEALTEYMKRRHIHLTVDLGMGNGQSEFLTCDLSHAYIDENMGTS